MALRNVFMEPLTSSTNGSLDGYFSEPHRTECSMMWGTPVESTGVVRNAILNTLLMSRVFIVWMNLRHLVCASGDCNYIYLVQAIVVKLGLYHRLLKTGYVDCEFK